MGLRNRQVELRFDKESGALVSLRNRVTGDEYLKDASAEGNPFRVWAGITKPDTLKPLPPYFENTTPDPQSSGGKPLEPAKCRLVDSSFERDAEAGVLLAPRGSNREHRRSPQRRLRPAVGIW